MDVIGLVAEFNPLHKGHRYIINCAKNQGDILVVLLNGSFTQRGEPVAQNKWMRAKNAIKAGADIVLTHPVTTATSAAPDYATGAIHALLALPELKGIICGIESEAIPYLKPALNDYQANINRDLFLEKINSGQSYSTAIKNTMISINPNYNKIFQPNAILAFEYAKALNQVDQLNKLILIPRISESNSGKKIFSATELRKFFNKQNPQHSHFQYNTDILMSKLYFIYRSLLILNKLDLKNITGYEIGIEHRLAKYALKSNNMKDFYNKVQTKRYSIPRIQRLLLHSVLSIENKIVKQQIKNNHRIFQILGISQNGRTYLKKIRNNDSIKLLTKFAQIKNYDLESQMQFHLEERATNLYSLLTNQAMNLDYNRFPFIQH